MNMKTITGKDLKQWAAAIPDSAIIEWHPDVYTTRWEPMPRGMLRAVLTMEMPENDYERTDEPVVDNS